MAPLNRLPVLVLWFHSVTASDVCEASDNCAEEVTLLQTQGIKIREHRTDSQVIQTLDPQALGSNRQVGIKCPLGTADVLGHRLFREPATGTVSSITRAECHALCQTTIGCNHYTYATGSDDHHVCMGCSSLENAQEQSNAITWDMDTHIQTLGSNRQVGIKCPLGTADVHGHRLFREPATGEVSSITRAECHALCQATNGCNHYTYATGTTDDIHVCMGCSSLENAQQQSNAITWDMIQTLGSNRQVGIKCPLGTADVHGHRLFREPVTGDVSSITRAECHALCQTTIGCNHYSYATGSDGHNVCKGCSSLENAQEQSNAITWDMGTQVTQTLGSNRQVGIKCPLGTADVHGHRLFREPATGEVSSITRAECHARCLTTNGCNHYTYATGTTDDIHVCMGCSSLENAQQQSNAITWDMVGQ